VVGSKPLGREGGGNYIYYGVREFGMSAIMNGLALHGGIIPYGALSLPSRLLQKRACAWRR